MSRFKFGDIVTTGVDALESIVRELVREYALEIIGEYDSTALQPYDDFAMMRRNELRAEQRSKVEGNNSKSNLKESK